MATTPGTPLSAKPASARWLWAVRVAAVIPLLLVFIMISWPFVSSLGHQCWEAPAEWGVLLSASIPVMMPYLHILWRLRREAERSGLRLAVVWGLAMFVFSILGVPDAVSGNENGLGFFLGYGFFALSQAAMVASALKACYAASAEQPNWQAQSRGYIPAVAYLVLVGFVAIYAPGVWRSTIAANQASAVGSLRTINTAEITYAETYKTGYSPTLAALGRLRGNTEPTASVGGLIDDVLVGGRKSGYSLTYLPGPKDSAGRIKSYTVVARPLEYLNCGTNGYFTDESGVIRQTSEDRPATAKDPPLAG